MHRRSLLQLGLTGALASAATAFAQSVGRTFDAAYPMVRTRVAGVEMDWPAGLLNIYQQQNAKITGEGMVDGDGKVFWDSYWAMRRDYDPRDLRWAADYDCRRPRLIHVYDSQQVEVSGLRIEYPVPLGIFFKSGHTRGGVISNIHLRDIHLQDVRTLMQVNLNWYPN